jgi:DNA-directed RNA polymerase, mitochondrial
MGSCERSTKDTMREKLIDSLKSRLNSEITNRSPLKYLRAFDVDDYVDTVISVVYLYTRMKKKSHKNSIYLIETIAAIGHNIRNKYKLKRDSALASKTGAFMLYTFEEMGILQVTLGQGGKGHNMYIIQVLDDDSICNLWNSIPSGQIEKLPSETPYAPWKSTKHETGVFLVKTGNKEVLDTITPETHPIIFDCVNRAQNVGWTINAEIYELHAWALRNKTEAFSDIWEQHNPEARATKTREAKAIGDIARRFLGKRFYHLYYYDFRGRKYPATAYLHEQGPDLARGLLLRADKKALGSAGFFWLLVAIASNWGGDAGREDRLKTDKLPLEDRFAWALDNEEILLAYAENPKVNQGWMKADKPWQFLAACIELKNLRVWQMTYGDELDPIRDFSYESHLECYIDGSNNGSQHLAALTKDEITAPHVNLVPQKYPGDLYAYVAEHVWARIEKEVAALTKEEIAACEYFIDNLIDLKKQIHEAEPKSDRRKELVAKIQSFKDKNRLLIEISAPVYWNRVKDLKERRKIVKRNTMTLPYGGTAYGLGEQIIDDSKKHGIELLMYLEHKWGAYMGRQVFQDCKISLKRPMELLTVFEKAGRKAEQEKRFLKWTVPVTHFPVVQNYTRGTIKKIWIQYGPPVGPRLNTGYFSNTLQLAICFIENVEPSKGKQSQGASPNAIHSLDAAHLSLTVHRADFPVSTIHDSFGALLADMPQLYTLIRRTFVELYQTDPLTSLMKDVEGDASGVELGSLDITEILKSEYAFS